MNLFEIAKWKLAQEKKKDYSKGSGVSFVDIDETVFETVAKVYVINKKTNKILHKLSNQEFNSYKLKDGEDFSFDEFKDPKLFDLTSKPIKNTIKVITRIINFIKNKSGKSKVVFITARQPFNAYKGIDGKTIIMNTFKKAGIPVNEKFIIFHFVGGSKNKLPVIKEYLDTKKYTRVRMFEDYKETLHKFAALKSEYPNIQFSTYLIKNKQVIPYNKTAKYLEKKYNKTNPIENKFESAFEIIKKDMIK